MLPILPSTSSITMNPLHYPDIERCKKLTEIGFPETELVFSDWEEDDYGNSYQTGEIILRGRGVPEPKPYYVCPSVMEMLDVIPNAIHVGKDVHAFRMNRDFAWYLGPEDQDLIVYFEGRPLPNALADLIFWLHENNYIKF